MFLEFKKFKKNKKNKKTKQKKEEKNCFDNKSFDNNKPIGNRLQLWLSSTYNWFASISSVKKRRHEKSLS